MLLWECADNRSWVLSHWTRFKRCTATSTGRVVMRSKAGETLPTRLAQGEAIAWGNCMRLANYSVRRSSRVIWTLQGDVGTRVQAERQSFCRW